MANLILSKPRLGVVAARGYANSHQWYWLFSKCDIHTIYSPEQLRSSMIPNYDLLLFPGGPDVPPDLYGEKNIKSYPDHERTEKEIKIYKTAKEKGIPVTGICYGCQLLNVLNGGKMNQHVQGHAGSDHTVTDGKNEFEVTSTHHQLMVPSTNAKVIAWAKIVTEQDPEALIWPDTGDFGVQFHPEYTHDPESKMVHWYKSFVKKQTNIEI